MRMHRLVIAVLAFCLVGLVPFTTASSAERGSSRCQGSGCERRDGRPAGPQREVRVQAAGPHELQVLREGAGREEQEDHAAPLQHQEGQVPHLQVRSAPTASGNYSWGGLKATGWFYVKVPSDKKYATSYSKLIRVYYM